MPKISVIIPVYKADNYLSRCLDSFTQQTFNDFEVILVDDGSPDKSGLICEDYSQRDGRFKTYHKLNEGVSNARQYGLEQAQGEFVIHADPDDWADNNMLEQLYECAINNSADVVICDFFKNINGSQEYIMQKPIALDPNSVIRSMYNGLYGACWNKLMRKSVIDKYAITFPKGWSLAEDQYFCLSLFLHDVKISYLNKAFYHYVIGENENSLAFATKRSFDYDKMMYEKFSLLTHNNPNHRLVRSIYAYSLVNNEFIRHRSSSISFSRKCLPYLCDMILSPTNIKSKVMFVLSCFGFYNYIYRAWLTLQK